jgi:phospholipase A-2-activating protein
MWHKGILVKEFEAHEDIIREIKEVPGIGFATCSNDQKVKLWTIDGQNIGEFSGHTSLVFSLICLDSGEIVSAAEDCTVRVWRDG